MFCFQLLQNKNKRDNVQIPAAKRVYFYNGMSILGCIFMNIRLLFSALICFLHSNQTRITTLQIKAAQYIMFNIILLAFAMSSERILQKKIKIKSILFHELGSFWFRMDF